MKDSGVIPKSAFNVVTTQEGDKTKLTITSKNPAEKPTFVGAITSPGDATRVTVTALDENNAPVGKSEKEVSDPKTPTIVKLNNPTPAKTLVIEMTTSTNKPTNADLVSVIACMEVKGMYLDFK